VLLRLNPNQPNPTHESIQPMGNESMPKIIINDTIIFFSSTAISISVISNHNSFRVLFDKKTIPYILFEKCIYILAVETASAVNRHCASCIGTLSFPVLRYVMHFRFTNDVASAHKGQELARRKRLMLKVVQQGAARVRFRGVCDAARRRRCRSTCFCREFCEGHTRSSS